MTQPNIALDFALLATPGCEPQTFVFNSTVGNGIEFDTAVPGSLEIKFTVAENHENNKDYGALDAGWGAHVVHSGDSQRHHAHSIAPSGVGVYVGPSNIVTVRYKFDNKPLHRVTFERLTSVTAVRPCSL